MSRDIRSFFTTVGGSKKKEDTTKLPVSNEKKNKSQKKRAIVLSDSDDDIIITSSIKKQKKQPEQQPKNVKKTPPKKELIPSPKAVNIMDVFGGGKIKRSTEKTHPEKKIENHKEKNSTVTFDDKDSDVDFETTLQLLDVDVIEAQANKAFKKKEKDDKDKQENDRRKKEEVQARKDEEARAKKEKEEAKAENEKEEVKAGNKKDKEQEVRSKKKLEDSAGTKKKHEEKTEKEIQSVKKLEVESKTEPKSDKKASSSSKHTKSDRTTTVSDKDLKSSVKEITPAQSEKKMTPIKGIVLADEDEHEDEPSWVNDPAEKKRLSAIGYQQYLNREGPKNLGSKEIPKGKPDCLKGLVFVVTGVLDSLEREAAAELIEECGGKVTKSLSRKTSFIVLGEDAGPSKVHKAKQFGTQQLDEDGLLDLIRRKSGITPVTKKSPEKDKVERIDKEKHKEPTSKLEKIVTPKAKDKEDKKESPARPMKEENKVVKMTENISSSKSPVPEKEIRKNHISSPVESSVSSTLAELPPSLLWVDKYRPTTTKQIIGQQGENSNVKKLTKWLQNWNNNQFGGKKLTRPSPWARCDDGAFFKAALLSGPPGVGKTTSAHLVCKELGLDVVEFNASDTRSKKLLHEEVSELLSSKSLYEFFRGGGKEGTSTKHVLLMDEVDGMAGNEDRGGIAELISLIKNSKVPVICMCNDVNHMKMRSLSGHCFDLRFTKPRVEQIRGAMLSVCFKEGVKMTPDALNNMIVASSQDVRQVLHHLALYTAKESSSAVTDTNHDPAKQLKNIKLGPWDVLTKVFSAEEHKKMTINDKSDLFFHDYSMSPLFVQENYLSVAPDAAKNNIYKRLDLLAAAADSICYGDVVDKLIRSKQAWSLLPAQAMYSSVIPGDTLEGSVTAKINFPSWLGKNSRRGKFDRLLQELHVHTRLSVSGSKQSLNMDYLPHLRDGISRPLVKSGVDGIPEAVQVMEAYHLIRADVDSIMELSVWPKQKDPMAGVEAKVKAAFTRTFNKESAMLPYSTAVGISKKTYAAASTVEGDLYEEEEVEEEQEENEDDVSSDAMIVAKKRPASKKESAAGPSAAKRGRGAGTSARGKGKGKTK